MAMTIPRRCDVVIRHGLVVDGTGAARRMADVAVEGERIVAVGDLSAVVGTVEIEAAGRIVAPGFIDVHTHGGGRRSSMWTWRPLTAGRASTRSFAGP